MFDKKRIYMDYAAATPLLPAAVRAMRKQCTQTGNPGALHKDGVASSQALEATRATIARTLNVKPSTLIFTSGGTESNNIAILGFARNLELLNALAGSEFVVSAIEHPSVLNCIPELERRGASVTLIDPDDTGHFTRDIIRKHLTPKTVFVSIGWANGEVGVVQPLRQIGQLLREFEKEHSLRRIIFHTDVGQAPLYESDDLSSLDVDLASFDASKMYGPSGVGSLYIRYNTPLSRITFGGGQEEGLRPGSEAVALCSGFAAAAAAAATNRKQERERLAGLRNYFLHELSARIPELLVNGAEDQLPSIVNVSLVGYNTEYILFFLDHLGISCSTKSSCRDGKEAASHVVESIYRDHERALSTLRFSMGTKTTKRDIQRAVAALQKALSASARL